MLIFIALAIVMAAIFIAYHVITLLDDPAYFYQAHEIRRLAAIEANDLMERIYRDGK